MNTYRHQRAYQRTRGLLLIGYGISPGIFAVAVLLLCLSIVKDVRVLLAGPLNSIGTVVTEVTDSAAKTADAIDNAIDPIATLNQRVTDALDAVGNIPTEVSVPSLPIPDANLPVSPNVRIQGTRPIIQMRTARTPMPTIPGFTLSLDALKQVKTVLQENFNIIGSLNGIVEKIPNLDALRGELQALVESSQQVISSSKNIAIKLLIVFVLVALIVAPWFYAVYVRPYLSWSFDNISKGWHLLQTPPA